MRCKFKDLFSYNKGWFRPRLNLQIGKASISPSIKFSKGITFDLIDLTKYRQCDVKVKKGINGLKILGFWY